MLSSKLSGVHFLPKIHIFQRPININLNNRSLLWKVKNSQSFLDTHIIKRKLYIDNIWSVVIFSYSRVGLNVPLVNYNPADWYLKVLFVESSKNEEYKRTIKVSCWLENLYKMGMGNLFNFFLKKICSHFPVSFYGKTLSNETERANQIGNITDMKIQLSSKIR